MPSNPDVQTLLGELRRLHGEAYETLKWYPLDVPGQTSTRCPGEILRDFSLPLAVLGVEIERLQGRERELEAALRPLIAECEAEFTLDGYWNNDGALVRRSTVKKAKAALKARIAQQSPKTKD